MSPSLDKHKPRSATEMLVEVKEQRDELAKALLDLVAAVAVGPYDPDVWRMYQQAQAALRKVPRVVFEKE